MNGRPASTPQLRTLAEFGARPQKRRNSAGFRELATSGAVRRQGLRPAKVFTSGVVGGPVGDVWARIRDCAGLGGGHDEIAEIVMIDAGRAPSGERRHGGGLRLPRNPLD